MESGLKIRFWNINDSSEEKMPDEAIKGEINKYDILFLCETWLRRENMNNLRHPNGYRSRKGRPSGGVLVYFRNKLNKVVSVFDKSNENILWIKIGKNSMNNKSNSYIA